MEDYIPDDLIVLKARVNPVNIGYINSIIEGYEGIGQVRTLDNRLGIIIFWIIPDQKELFDNLIGEFERELGLVVISEDYPL